MHALLIWCSAARACRNVANPPTNTLLPLLAWLTIGGGGLLAAELHFRRHEVNRESTYCPCAVFDINKDGKPDVICGGFWYEALRSTSAPAPQWKRHFVRAVEMIRGRYDDYSHLPLDVNGDGWIDIVSANYRSEKLYWVQHPGLKLGPWPVHVVEKPGHMEPARLADIDGDGQLDILPNGTDFAAWWELKRDAGEAKFVRHDLPAEVAGHGIGFGDINGDGRGDLVSPRGWLEAPADRRKERWIWHAEFELHRDGSIPILVFDVDGDGDNDLLWGRGHNFGLYWLEQTLDGKRNVKGERGWTRHAIDTSLSQLHSLLVGDLDGDGRDEIVTGKRYLGHDGRDLGEHDPLAIVAYSWQRETRTFLRRTIHDGGTVGFGLDPKLADLDADGDLDVVCPGRSGLYWLENLHGTTAAGPPPTERKEPRYADHSRLLTYRDEAAKEHEVKTLFDWGLRRSHVLQDAQLAMGKMPSSVHRVPLDVEILSEEDAPKYTRKKLLFSALSEKVATGHRVPAYLLVPKGLTKKAPAMLCLHQTAVVGKGEPVGFGLKTLHYAHELAERGYVCLAPDYPSFGDYKIDFQAQPTIFDSGTMRAIWNNLRAVDLLESLSEVDGDKIGCIGHSLGGHNTIFTAVFDQRIKALVSSCGFTAFHHYYGGKLAGWTSDRYMPRIRDVYENNPSKVPFDFYELVAALAPRPFYINAPLHDSNFENEGVKKVVDKAGEIYKLLGAEGKLHAAYPDVGHDFPDEQRQEAYEFLDKWLK